MAELTDVPEQVHDVDVAVMSLHTCMSSLHVGVTNAVFEALESLIQMAQPLSTRNMQTIIKTCVPLALQRLADVPIAQAWLLHMSRIVYKDVLGSARMREGDAPHSMWEHTIRDAGLGATSPHVREHTLQLLVSLQDCALPLQMLLPFLVDGVQDPDANVRAAAKTAISSLYAPADPTLRSELKLTLMERHVHASTFDEIMQSVVGHTSTAADAAEAPATPTPRRTMTTATTESSTSSSPSLTLSSKMPELPAELVSVPSDDIRPVHILSHYDMEHAFASAAQALDGKETETNWQPREKAIITMRGMLKGTVPDELSHAFLMHIRSLQEGILKALASLRTTLAMHAIGLIRQLALTFGAHLEHTLDAFLTSLMRMAGFTKKIVATASQLAVSTILACASVRHSYWQLLSAGLQDKSAATRVYMCKHLGVILHVHGQRRADLEAHHGLEMMMQCLGRALGDPSAEVRSAARDVFFPFHNMYRAEAEQVLMSCAPATRKQVAASLEHVPSLRRTPTRAGPSRAIVAAKRAAMHLSLIHI